MLSFWTIKNEKILIAIKLGAPDACFFTKRPAGAKLFRQG